MREAIGGGKTLLKVSQELSVGPLGGDTWGINPLADHGTHTVCHGRLYFVVNGGEGEDAKRG